MNQFIEEARTNRAHYHRMTFGPVTLQGFQAATKALMQKNMPRFTIAFSEASTEERLCFVELVDDTYFQSVPIQNFIAELFVIKFRALKMANCTGEGNEAAMEYWRFEKATMLKDSGLKIALANATEYDLQQWNNMVEDPEFLV